MTKEDVQTASGMSVPGIVFIVFLVLKLTGCIGWSWWWVTSPLWIMGAIIIGLTLLYVVAFALRYRKFRGHRLKR